MSSKMRLVPFYFFFLFLSPPPLYHSFFIFISPTHTAVNLDLDVTICGWSMINARF